MIADPDRYLEPFVKAGASRVSVHVEVAQHLHRTIDELKKMQVMAGVVLNPATPVSSLEAIAADVDFVLVMSVNPGFSGQKFIPSSVAKIRAVRALLDRVGNPAPIEVDGGVDPSTIAEVVKAGARWLVAGQAVFGGGDPEGATRALRALAVLAADGQA
jgi:ribulose-phosphate 3-epimerase